VGADRDAIVQAATQRAWPAGPPPPVFGDGHAAERIVEVLADSYAQHTRQPDSVLDSRGL
jgi:hypothetical protein